MTVADYIIQRLAEVGVGHMFAVPGDYASPFLKKLDASPLIQRVSTLTELGAGYAADGYARFNGVGALSVQYGVGAFSALNCMAGSYVERVPVAMIVGSPAADARELERTKGILFHHSTGDLAADKKIYEHVTVASLILTDATKAPEQIDAAIVAMLTHHCPIYIEVIQNLWDTACDEPKGKLEPVVLTSDPGTLSAALAATEVRIRESKSPILWLGVQLQRYGFQDLTQSIVDASGLAFTTTSLGKTVLDESQPAFAGTYAGPASPASTEKLMTNTDLPIALGTIITDDYLDIMKASFGDMIEATDEGVRIGYSRYPGVAFGDFLKGLLDLFQNDSTLKRALPPPVPAQSVASYPLDLQLTYNIFYLELSAYLETRKAEIALILGESTSLYVFGNLFGLPQNAFVSQAAWGSLGHETGCALGVAIGSKKRPIVVAGDGGFSMVCQELASLAKARVPAIVFVMSNEAYAIEQAFVDINAFKPEGSFAPFDLLPKFDYLALAQAFGVRGLQVSTVGELQTVLTEVDSLTEPALIQVIIPQKDLAPQLKRLAEDPG